MRRPSLVAAGASLRRVAWTLAACLSTRGQSDTRGLATALRAFGRSGPLSRNERRRAGSTAHRSLAGHSSRCRRGWAGRRRAWVGLLLQHGQRPAPAGEFTSDRAGRAVSRSRPRSLQSDTMRQQRPCGATAWAAAHRQHAALRVTTINARALSQPHSDCTPLVTCGRTQFRRSRMTMGSGACWCGMGSRRAEAKALVPDDCAAVAAHAGPSQRTRSRHGLSGNDRSARPGFDPLGPVVTMRYFPARI
jgi:hypothetical protein